MNIINTDQKVIFAAFHCFHDSDIHYFSIKLQKIALDIPSVMLDNELAQGELLSNAHRQSMIKNRQRYNTALRKLVYSLLQGDLKLFLIFCEDSSFSDELWPIACLCCFVFVTKFPNPYSMSIILYRQWLKSLEKMEGAARFLYACSSRGISSISEQLFSLLRMMLLFLIGDV